MLDKSIMYAITLICSLVESYVEMYQIAAIIEYGTQNVSVPPADIVLQYGAIKEAMGKTESLAKSTATVLCALTVDTDCEQEAKDIKKVLTDLFAV